MTAKTKKKIPGAKVVWAALRLEAKRIAASEPLLRKIISSRVLSCKAMPDALAILLSDKLADAAMPARDLCALFSGIYKDNPAFEDLCTKDLLSILRRDPAATDLLTPFLFFKGFHALQAYRLTHALWTAGRRPLALFLQNRISVVFGVDIHPAAKIGHGVIMDHATGIVIGETAVVGNNVLILHNVTLGTKGKSHETGNRHPIIEDGVTLGAGAQVLGRIVIGRGAYVAASSLLIKSVAAGDVVAGVPARPIKNEVLSRK